VLRVLGAVFADLTGWPHFPAQKGPLTFPFPTAPEFECWDDKLIDFVPSEYGYNCACFGWVGLIDPWSISKTIDFLLV